MYKLMILFKKPDNVEEFQNFYYDEFIPRVFQVEGLEQVEFTKVLPPTGILYENENYSPFGLQIEIYFQTRKHFQHFLTKHQIGKDFRSELAKFGDAIYTFTWGQPEIISKSDIVTNYNKHIIHSIPH